MSRVLGRDVKGIHRALKRSFDLWGLEDLDPTLLGNSDSIVFLCFKKKARVVVRVTEDLHRSREELEGELDWIEYLSRNGVRIALPIETEEREMLSSFELGGQLYHVSVFSWAPGHGFDAKRHGDGDFARELGRYIGKIHALTKDYTQAEGATRRTWEHILKSK